MRVSGYISGSPINGSLHYVVMHGYTGAVDKISAELGKALLSCRGKPLETITLSGDTEKVLRKRGYITDLEEEDEVKLVKSLASEIHSSELKNRPFAYSIIPSYGCNLRCPYCFQPHDIHSGKNPKSRLMSDEQVRQIFRFIDVEKVRRPTSYEGGLPITLFGGEPLTRNTLPIVNLIAEETVRRGGSISAVSNGLELQHFSHLLGAAISEIQVTLDGLASLNNKRRVGPGFRDTFELICRNVESTLDAGVNVKIRINTDKTNVDQIRPLHDHFAQRGWYKRPNFYPYAAVVHNAEHSSRRTGETVLSHKELIELTLDLQEEVGVTVESYERPITDFLEQALLGKGYPFQSVSSCSAETGQLMFDPLGDVYSCWEDVGFADQRVARYDEGGLAFVGSGFQEWLSRSPGNIDGCAKCPYAFIHKSGCGQHARVKRGTIFSSECESFKEYFPTVFGRLYAELEQRVLSQA